MREILNQILKFLQQGISAIFRFVELIWNWSVASTTPPRGRGDRLSERQSDAERFDRIEREFGIEAALDVGGLPETVLLA
jgi:hypothetical protein